MPSFLNGAPHPAPSSPFYKPENEVFPEQTYSEAVEAFLAVAEWLGIVDYPLVKDLRVLAKVLDSGEEKAAYHQQFRQAYSRLARRDQPGRPRKDEARDPLEALLDGVL